MYEFGGFKDWIKQVGLFLLILLATVILASVLGIMSGIGIGLLLQGLGIGG